jgi:hypothetical protein
MFRSYDHLHVKIYTVEINSTDNGSVVFDIMVDYRDRCIPSDGQYD